MEENTNNDVGHICYYFYKIKFDLLIKFFNYNIKKGNE